MKTTYSGIPNAYQLVDIKPGTVVRFHSTFHQNHNVSDFFLVLDDNGYLLHEHQQRSKITVANLKTGQISVVSKGRTVTRYDSEVSIWDASR